MTFFFTLLNFLSEILSFLTIYRTSLSPQAIVIAIGAYSHGTEEYLLVPTDLICDDLLLLSRGNNQAELSTLFDLPVLMLFLRE